MEQLRKVDVGSLLAHQARTRPQALAIADAGERLDFATLNQRVDRLARGLAHAGITAGDRVAVRLPNSHRHHACLFACARLGAMMVPIDAALDGADVARQIRDSGAALLVDSETAFDTLVKDAPGPAFEPEPQTGADPSLVLLYTSGTTGRPKGVVLTHANVIATVFNQMLGWGLNATDRALVVAPFHHAGGLLAFGLPCLCAGGAMHIAPREPQAVVDMIEAERISALFLPPVLWQRVAGVVLAPERLSSARICASGGDPLPLPLLETLRSAFTAEFTDAYGMTETASAVTLLHGDHILRKAGSTGTPLPLTHLRILRDDDSEATVDEIGKIVLAGPTVMKEYWNIPDETASALRGGWFHTGDLGRIDAEGFLYVAGRSRDVIVSGGARVYPSEVERVLRNDPDVDEAAVIGIPNAALGQTVAAVVVPRQGVELSAERILALCRDRIAGDSWPRTAFFCDALPRDSNGKVSKAALQAKYGAGV